MHYYLALIKKFNPGKLRYFCVLFGDDFLNKLSEHKPRVTNELSKYKQWYSDLKKLRDPSAHRIPLSFITSILNQQDKDEYDRKIVEYNNLLKTMSKNSSEKSLDIINKAYNTLHDANNIGKFEPIIVAMDNDGQEMKSALNQITADMNNIIDISHIVLNDDYFKNCT